MENLIGFFWIIFLLILTYITIEMRIKDREKNREKYKEKLSLFEIDDSEENSELNLILLKTKLLMQYGLSEQSIINLLSKNENYNTYIKKAIKTAYKLYDKQDPGIFVKNPTMYSHHKIINIIAMIFMTFAVYQFSLGMWNESFLPFLDAKVFIVLSIVLYMWHSPSTSIVLLISIVSSLVASFIFDSNIAEIIIKIFLAILATKGLYTSLSLKRINYHTEKLNKKETI